MAISRQKKEEIIAKVSDIVKEAKSVIFVNFHGLSVEKANEMRRTLKEKGVLYTVAKKSLMRRVLGEAHIQGESPKFTGEIALAYGADQILPAKSIVEFEKKFGGAVTPLGGIFETKYISLGEVEKLSKIPSREILYGQFVAALNAPIQQTAGILNAVTQSFVSVLHHIAKSKEV